MDECHHVPAVTFERAVRQIPVRRWLGLTATPYGVTDSVDDEHVLRTGTPPHGTARGTQLLHRQVVVHPTSHVSVPGEHYQEILDPSYPTRRTAAICADVAAAAAEGRNSLVLTRWTGHLEAIIAGLSDAVSPPWCFVAGWARRPPPRHRQTRRAGTPRSGPGRHVRAHRRRLRLPHPRHRLPGLPDQVQRQHRPTCRAHPPAHTEQDPGPRPRLHRHPGPPTRTPVPGASPRVRQPWVLRPESTDPPQVSKDAQALFSDSKTLRSSSSRNRRYTGQASRMFGAHLLGHPSGLGLGQASGSSRRSGAHSRASRRCCVRAGSERPLRDHEPHLDVAVR